MPSNSYECIRGDKNAWTGGLLNGYSFGIVKPSRPELKKSIAIQIKIYVNRDFFESTKAEGCSKNNLTDQI